MTTLKQKKANRKNAQKSSGPVSDKGKQISSKNALQHGILSSEVVIGSREIDENQEEYDQIKQNFVNDLQPEGAVESMLLDRIVSTYWRLRRVLKAEKGIIRSQSDNLVYKNVMKRLEVANEHKKYSTLYSYHSKVQNSYSALWIKTKFKGYRKKVEDQGFLPDREMDTYTEIIKLYYDESEFLWLHFFNDIAKGKVEQEDKSKGKKALLYLLDKEIEKISLGLEVAQEIERSIDESDSLTNVVPLTPQADILMRYETSLENQLYKAINHLIKYQALRRGGKVISVKGEIEGIDT